MRKSSKNYNAKPKIKNPKMKKAMRGISGWRIKHLPTGLYYCPSRNVTISDGVNKCKVKSNLSAMGKAYSMIPSVGWIGSQFQTHLWTSKDFQNRTLSILKREPDDLWADTYQKRMMFNYEEWVIEKYNG